MWAKICGAVLIIAAGVLVGENRYKQWQIKVKTLEQLLLFAEYLQIELIYRERLLPVLLREGAQRCSEPSLQRFLQSWALFDAKALSDPQCDVESLGLSGEEQHVVQMLCENLGQTAMADQERLIGQFSEQLQRLLAERRQKGESLVRLWRYCSIFTAAIIIIVLI